MKRKLIKAAALGLSFLVASAFCACGEHGKDDSVDEDGQSFRFRIPLRPHLSLYGAAQ